VRNLTFVVALVVIAAGCGEAEERSGGGSASTSHPVESGPSLPFDEAEKTKAPLILLESEAGIQSAVPGSSCVDYVDEASGQGVGVCGDSGPVSPELLSTVRPGQEIRILVEDADVIRPEGCQSEDEQECIGSAVVRPLGCEEQTMAEIPLLLGPETTWSVDLAPGDYELDVFAYFDAPDGRSGDVTGSLGLRVDEAAPLELVPAAGSSAGCPASR
jgi:hypothetical protein